MNQTKKYTVELYNGTFKTFESAAKLLSNRYFPDYKGSAVERLAGDGFAAKLIGKNSDLYDFELEIYELEDGSKITVNRNGEILEFIQQPDL